MNNYDKLVAAGAENCHPKFIGVVDGTRQVVAEVVDEVVYLTDAGREFLADADKPSPRKKRLVEQVSVPDDVASIDLE